MNKKLNTALFLIGATILNLMLLAVIALLLVLGFGAAYRNIEEVSAGLSWLAIIVILFGSIAGTFFLYSRIIKWIVKRFNLDNYIEPIFRQKRR